MNKYRWRLNEISITDRDISRFPEISPVILNLLFQRGLKTQEEIDKFISPDYSKDLNNPLLFKNMPKALDRIYSARDKGENVLIYGDYDADGVCGSAILHKTFRKIGITFQTYLPDREKEGYGLNQKAIQQFAEENVNLVITVDCGISNANEVSLANKLGMEVIITDHHYIQEKIPDAICIIHPSLDPSYPFGSLSGGGVAFKLAQALLADPRSGLSKLEAEVFEKWLLDLAAISTVADMVPMTGENRVIVKYGLFVLAKTKNLGIKKLMEVSQVNENKLDTFTIGFQLAPRLNAAGRMSHANNAYRLLTTENIEEAIIIAHELNKKNIERQNLTQVYYEASKLQIGKVSEDIPAVFAVGQGWNKGIIGLVASKLTQEYSRPAIVFSKDTTDDFYTASARSIPELNLIEALGELNGYFMRYGGHKGAAGFSIKQELLEEFQGKFSELCKNKLKGVAFIPEITIDSKIKISQIDWQMIESLDNFLPYGEANPKPKFLIEGAVVVLAETVGQDSSHLRLIVKDEGIKRKIICFGFGSVCELLKPGDRLNAVCEIGVNEWNGNKEIQLSLNDFKKHG